MFLFTNTKMALVYAAVGTRLLKIVYQQSDKRRKRRDSIYSYAVAYIESLVSVINRDCNPGIPEYRDPGNFPIPKSRD